LKIEYEWDSEPYITAYTFRKYCDHAFFTLDDSPEVRKHGNQVDPLAVKNNDRIFVVTDLLDIFMRHVHRQINCNYQLLTSRSDVHITQEIADQVLQDQKITKWHAVNCSAKSDKIISIPLGLDNRTWKSPDNARPKTELIEQINEEMSDVEPSKNFLVSFNEKTNRSERLRCHKLLSGLENSTFKMVSQEDSYKKNPQLDFYRAIKSHRFVVCPWGNGFDCHRNWQTWYLKGIPVIRRHPALEFCFDLPAWWIDDWDELHGVDYSEKYEEIRSRYESDSLNKLWFDHWKGLL
jgi:hypothetical protein